MNSNIRAAVVQAGSVPFDADATLQCLAEKAVEAAAQGAKLAVFPEAFIGGYPKGCTFSTPVGFRTPEAREAYRQYFEAAIEVPGTHTTRLEEIARENDLFIVVGVIERELGTLYCTVLFIDPQQGLIGKHRKLMPTAAERLIWGFGDGSTLPVLETPLGRIGAVICWENYMPMLRMAMYAKGIQLYCAPTADDRDSWVASMQHIALEGRCFVLSSCQYITRGAYPTDYKCELGDEPETVLLRGGSLIIDPLGNILAGPLYGTEGILYADLDMAQISRGKYDFDVAGHYARPDIFRLLLDENPKTPIIQA
ncbi:carbon-nitrogen hydrolase family protein [Pseudomonas cavernicola]|uniref:Carbon-nitrogen hydrolase family protein n=1 Tax=Pseudomonas cavernicola TaxID=2320866 RepID=A0A418XMX5_9PSED|nr:carbon-nitrogen hydrolase family protein [Pseudomonas cavernicola]RJG13813.1 carbon-nitrogen hydrolase family protein [Pseudomonas cavernicola]